MWNYHSWPLDVSRNMKLPFLTTRYLLICHCTGISLYFLISWLFWMESHWPHRIVKRSLCALAVSNGGGRTSPVSFSSNDCFEWVLIDGMDMHRVRSFSLAVSFRGEDITCHFLIKWLFQMGSHWWYGNTLLSLFCQAVSNGGRGGEGEDIGQSRFVCQIWAPGRLGVLTNEVFSLREDQKGNSPDEPESGDQLTAFVGHRIKLLHYSLLVV